MKMGITRSPFPYDPGTYYSSRLARLRLLAISRCAKLGATVFLISKGVPAFAQKMIQAKDISELIQIQRMLFEWQIQVLNEQVKDLGETAATAAGNVKDLREISEAA